jgi:uncharacterized protein YcnI
MTTINTITSFVTRRRRMLAVATAVLASGALVAPASVSAHASLQLYGESATPGGYGVVFVRIPHGCTGGLATNAVEVTIPAGFASVRPQQIPGWTASRQMSGTTVVGVAWTGGSLSNAEFADFGISVKYPDTAGTYGMKVVQRCGTASATWDGADLPTLVVAPKVTTYAVDMKASSHDGKVHVIADAPTTMAGEKPVLTIAVDGKVVRKMRLTLDDRGDVHAMLPVRGKTVRGKNYEVLDGATFTLTHDGAVVGKSVLDGDGAMAAGSAAHTAGHSGH